MFFNRKSPSLSKRLADLKSQLQEQDPDRVAFLPTYLKMDKVLYRLGLLKRDQSLAMGMVMIKAERNEDIAAALEGTARDVEAEALPALENALKRWRKLTLLGDAFGIFVAAALVFGAVQEFGQGPFLSAYDSLKDYVLSYFAVATSVGVLALVWHHIMRKVAARSVRNQLAKPFGDHKIDLRHAFIKNTGLLRSVFASNLSGWNKKTQRILDEVHTDMAEHSALASPSVQTPSAPDMAERHPISAE